MCLTEKYNLNVDRDSFWMQSIKLIGTLKLKTNIANESTKEE